MQNNQEPKETTLNVSEVSEISLLEILFFLKQVYKTILIFGAFGLVAAVIYLAVTPKKYEAVAQFAMAQIAASNNSNNSTGTNIEGPALLIARLSSPTSFTPETIAACGFEDQPHANTLLAKEIKLVPGRSAPDIAELKTFGTSPAVAMGCANSVFNLIQKTQAQIVAPYTEEAKIKLVDDEGRLDKVKEFLSRSDKGGLATSAAYLSTRDEMRYLLDEIAILKNIISINQSRVTRLIAPIYVSDVPIEPRKVFTLMVGLFGGLFLGLLIALGKQMIARPKSQ